MRKAQDARVVVVVGLGLWVGAVVLGMGCVFVAIVGAVYVDDILDVLYVRPSTAECAVALCVGLLFSQVRRGRAQQPSR